MPLGFVTGRDRSTIVATAGGGTANDAFLQGLDAMRQVHWSNKYLWDIRFQQTDLPAPFNN